MGNVKFQYQENDRQVFCFNQGNDSPEPTIMGIQSDYEGPCGKGSLMRTFPARLF